MIEKPQAGTVKRDANARHLLLPMLICTLAMSGCIEDEAMDYCKNHYRFHPQHRDDLATLTVNLDDAGQLRSELLLPYAPFGVNQTTARRELSRIANRLGHAGQFHTLQSAQPCTEPAVSPSFNATGLRLTALADCGKGNKVEQVDVALLDSLPELDEIEVEVTTPATKKHFAISRQCDHPLFRLNH